MLRAVEWRALTEASDVLHFSNMKIGRNSCDIAVLGSSSRWGSSARQIHQSAILPENDFTTRPLGKYARIFIQLGCPLPILPCGKRWQQTRPGRFCFR